MRPLLVVVSCLLLAPALVRADVDRTPDARQMHTDDCARARKQHKTCVIDMGKAEDITGNSPTAGGFAIKILELAKAGSLIRLRRHFIVEILKTTEDL